MTSETNFSIFIRLQMINKILPKFQGLPEATLPIMCYNAEPVFPPPGPK